MKKYSKLSVHGRFQPVMHINHWNYVKYAFDNSEFVTICITNPESNEKDEPTASWRNKSENNPFTFQQRKQMFEELLAAKGISPDRYHVTPLNITDKASVQNTANYGPMVVNVYSDWSSKKVQLFNDAGVETIVTNQPRIAAISGTKIREVLRDRDGDLESRLLDAGLLPEAIAALIRFI